MQTKQEIINQAVEIAKGVLAGTVQPNSGCDKIAQLCQLSELPKELLSFYALAHEQHGHEQFGFNVENTAPLILEECRLLVEKCS